MNELQMEFITPAFCAGADQSRAEIRVPSIRGHLHWWFRVLGGTREQERRVFGGVHGDPVRSTIMLRVTDIQTKSDKGDLHTLTKHGPQSPLAYLAYFITVSGEPKGLRWRENAFFSPGTSFRLLVRKRRPMEPEDEMLFEKALTAWTRLGVLGTRGTRGFGALHNLGHETLSADELLAWCGTLSTIKTKQVDPPAKDWPDALYQLGSFLKTVRADYGLSGKSHTVLGSSDPRQTSALSLRPVKVKEGILPLVFYTEYALPTTLSKGRAEINELFS